MTVAVTVARAGAVAMAVALSSASVAVSVAMAVTVAQNDTSYKRWSCHSGHKLLYKLCRTFPPPAMGLDLPFLVMPVMWTRWMAGTAAHKSG